MLFVCNLLLILLLTRKACAPHRDDRGSTFESERKLMGGGEQSKCNLKKAAAGKEKVIFDLRKIIIFNMLV